MHWIKIIAGLAVIGTLSCWKITASAEENVYAIETVTYAELTKIHDDMSAGNNSAALKKLKALIASHSLKDYDAAVVYQTMAYAENALNNLENAVQHSIQALSYHALPEKQTHELNFSTAQLLIQLDRPAEGLKYLEKWFAGNPPKAEAYLLAAIAHYDLKNYSQLNIYAEKAISMNDQAPLNWYELLLSGYFETKDYQKAAPVLEKIIDKNPDKPDYWLQLAALYQYLKQDKKTLAVYELAYAKKLLKEEGIIQLVKNLLYFEMPYKAAGILEKEIGAGVISADQEILILLANSWTLAKEDEKAQAVLSEIVEIYHDDKTRLRLAQLYYQTKKWDSMLAILDVEFKTDDQQLKSGLNLLLGIALYHTNHHSRAIQALTSALSHKSTEDQAEWWLQYIKNKPESEKQG